MSIKNSEKVTIITGEIEDALYLNEKDPLLIVLDNEKTVIKNLDNEVVKAFDEEVDIDAYETQNGLTYFVVSTYFGTQILNDKFEEIINLTNNNYEFDDGDNYDGYFGWMMR